MRILIVTGIYPPRIGGPAQYAKNIVATFQQLGHQVTVKTYNLENNLPTGLRHLYFFCKILPAVIKSDWVLALDTFSVGLPTVMAARLFGKKMIIRTGGDFLWESYVERTGDLVLLSKFYQTSLGKLSPKEKIIFKLTRWTLHRASLIVFSTDWHWQIWRGPYQLDLTTTAIIENYYGPKLVGQSPAKKNFVFAGRAIKLKNLDRLEAAFAAAQKVSPDIILDKLSLPHAELMVKLRAAYAVIVPSLSEISPNLILEAVSCGKPVIVTSDCGLLDRLSGIAVIVDPLDVDDMKAKILWLASPENYERQLEKIRRFNYTHSWQEIAQEFLGLSQKI